MAFCNRNDVVWEVEGMLIVAQESEASLNSELRGFKAAGTTVGANYPSTDYKPAT
jgi:hypothetical protein